MEPDVPDFDEFDFESFFDDLNESDCTDEYFDYLSQTLNTNSLSNSTTICINKLNTSSTMTDRDNSLESNRMKKRLKSTNTPNDQIKTTDTQSTIIHHKSYLPCVPSTDIRRQYTTMFTNTLNSLDFSLFLQFMTKYSSPDFLYYQTYTGTTLRNVDHHPRFVLLRGVLSVAQYWFNKLQNVPDIAYLLLNTKLHTWDNTECSKAVSTINVSATRLFDIKHDVFVHLGNSQARVTEITPEGQQQESTADNVMGVGAKRKPASSSSYPPVNGPMKNESIDMSSINTESIASYLSSLPLASPPELHRIAMFIKLTMHLDENKYVNRMEFQITPREEKKTDIQYN